jgi:hypothetical protein
MKIEISCTANLGDFMNAMPVLSGISKSTNEKIELIIRPEMRKFNGLKQLLKKQEMFADVNFKDEVFVYGAVKNLSSWTRMDQNDPMRPVETCRYENWFKDNYKIDFNVDDDFELKIEDVVMEASLRDKIIIGDRWGYKQDPTIDSRRATNVIEQNVQLEGLNVKFLDYNDDITYNCNLIKYSNHPFVTTFTGIGIVADLLNKETIVCWGDDMRVWDGHPVEYDFIRHYYGNRKSKLVYVKDVKL